MTTASQGIGAPIGRQQNSEQSSPPVFEWQREFLERHQKLEQARESGLPSFVVANDFVEIVLERRHFAATGTWPKGKPSSWPKCYSLAIWQRKWITLQSDPVKFAEWQAKMQQRRDDKSASRRAAERESLLADIAATPHDEPLPITLSPLGRFVTRRAKVA